MALRFELNILRMVAEDGTAEQAICYDVPAIMGKRILVLAGDGAFGRRISQAVAAIPSAECVMGVSNPNNVGAHASAVVVNVHDPASLRRALEGVFAVVNSMGPFQGREYTVAETCAGMGIHYVDLADTRAYVEGITRLQHRAQQKNCVIVSGASSVLTVSSALVEMLVPEFDRVTEIHACISPGNKNPFGEAMVRTILSYAGNPLRFKDQGRWHYAYGWSNPKVVLFPKPVGKRRVYLCDVPDLDIFPMRYGAHTVTFRAGLELNLFNYGLVILGRLRRWGWITNLSRWAPGLTAFGRFFHGFGKVSGGMRVLVRGRKHEQEAEHTVFLLARDANGPAFECSPAVALIRKWVEHGVTDAGAQPCVGLLTWDEIKAEMVDYDITLVRE
ncbi:MAG: saccharopine dehydrogenase family protein [Sulfuricaulis sp.]